MQGRKLIEGSAKKLNKLYPGEGIDLWRQEVVAFLEGKDLISGGSYDSDLLVDEVYNLYKEKVISQAKKIVKNETLNEIREYTSDFQSWKSEQNFKKGGYE